MEIPQGLFNHITTRLIPINGLPANKQRQLLDNIVIETHPVGSYLFEQGDTDNYVYYLLAGKINMMATDQSSFIIDPNLEHALYPIGQMQPRQYSAHIINETQILKIKKSLFDSLMESDRATPPVYVGDSDDPEADCDWMTNLLSSGIFANLPPQNIQKIFDLFEEIPVNKNDRIISQGESGDYFYIVKEGKFEVSRFLEKQKKLFKLAIIQAGESFGEESLLGNMPRNASVTAITDGTLMRLPKEYFLSLIRDPAIEAIDYDEAIDLINDGGAWLDVRNPDRHKIFAFEDSLNYPLDTLRIQMNKLNSDTKYVVYCDNGSRSAIAAYLLLKNGYSVSHLDGGITKYRRENTMDELKACEMDKRPAYAKQPIKIKKEDNKLKNQSNNLDNTDILIKSLLSQQQNGDQLSKILRTVLMSVMKQLEQALKEKVEAEIAKNIAEQKLEAFMHGQIVNLVPAGVGKLGQVMSHDTK